MGKWLEQRGVIPIPASGFVPLKLDSSTDDGDARSDEGGHGGRFWLEHSLCSKGISSGELSVATPAAARTNHLPPAHA